MRLIPAAPPPTASDGPDRLLVTGLFVPGAVTLAHWEIDRTVVGGAVPLAEPLPLAAAPALRAPCFCARRELGVVNLGAGGAVEVDGVLYSMNAYDGLYIGRGAERVVFHSEHGAAPARFYLLSYPAHCVHPTRAVPLASRPGEALGTPAAANRRILRKYIAPGLVESCQLVMGLTIMELGGVWNTMPPHTHARRSEVYCYAELGPEDAVFHFLGDPAATRHVVARNLEVVLSPSGSIHAGVGTASYAFVWGMGGENQDFADMDPVAVSALR